MFRQIKCYKKCSLLFFGGFSSSQFYFSFVIFMILIFDSVSFKGLVVKVLDSQSRCPVFKTTGWLQGQLNSSFGGQSNEYQEFLGT